LFQAHRRRWRRKLAVVDDGVPRMTDSQMRQRAPDAWQAELARRLPARPLALLLVYIDAWQEGWPGAGPDGLGATHRGWIAHCAFWRREGPAALRYRQHFRTTLKAKHARDRARVTAWLDADLGRARRFFGALRLELFDRLHAMLGPRTILARRPWRAGISIGPWEAGEP
jgi:hypothetical protein